MANLEVVQDEGAAVRGIAAHIEAEEGGDLVFVIAVHADGCQAHGTGIDEGAELGGGDFAEAFEAGNFRGFEGFQGGVAFGFAVAVTGFSFIADAEERGFEDEDVSGEDQGFEEAEEEGEEEVSDMEAVDVGVCGHDNFLEAEGIEGIFDIEGAHEVVEFLVGVDGLAREFGDVEGLTAQGEDGLGTGVSGLRD